ncbi:MAG: alpha/beta fold hydrolase [Spirochaetaceae bacterium]|nr:MAG: alpha/beta fold hydrolase [Spirochaetaceae bacterium]
MNRNQSLLLFLILGTVLLFIADSSGFAQIPTGISYHTEPEGDSPLEYFQYMLFLPQDYYEKSAAAWPLIVYLHGNFQKGTDPQALLSAGLPKILETQTDFSFLVLAPHCNSLQEYRPDMIVNLIDRISGTIRVDRNRIYLTGWCYGGGAAWVTAHTYPDRFAALVPVAAPADVMIDLRELSDLPVWVFHGAKDSDVPASDSKTMVEALRDCEGNVRFTLYTNLDHDCWERTYTDKSLYRWLLRQDLRHRH